MTKKDGTVKLEIEDWLIIEYERFGIGSHTLRHGCAADGFLYPVGYYKLGMCGPENQYAATPAAWRCVWCHKQAPDGIVGAFSLLEPEYSSDCLQNTLNNT